jgi:hypothetical protein
MAAYQNPLLLQPLQLPLGHVQPEAKGFGNALGMPLSIALQKQQHIGGGAITKQSLQNRVHD